MLISHPPYQEYHSQLESLPHHHAVKRRLITGISWAFILKSLTMLMGVLLNALLARLLSKEDFGAFLLFSSVILIASEFGQFGLGNASIRLIAEARGKKIMGQARANVKLILTYAFLSSSLIALFFAFGGWKWLVVSFFPSDVLSSIYLFASVFVLLSSIQVIIGEIFRGFFEIQLASVFGGPGGGLLHRIFYVLGFGIFLLGRKSASLENVLKYKFIVDFLALCIALVLLSKLISWYKSSEKPASLAQLCVLAYPFLITDIARYFYSTSDLLFLGAYRPLADVAVYGAALRLIQFIVLPLVLINTVLPPLITELYVQGEKQRLQRTLQTTAGLAGIPAALLLLLFILFGKNIMGLIYGEYYAAGSIVLIILSAAQLFGIWAGSCGIVLNMTGHQNTMMRISISTSVLTIVGVWLVAGKYGSLGVAIVSACTTILQNILMLLYAKKKSGVWTFAKFNLLSFPTIIKTVLQKQ